MNPLSSSSSCRLLPTCQAPSLRPHASLRRPTRCDAGNNEGGPGSRRAVLQGAVAALLALGASQRPAQAEVKGFTPMPSLKGKDYGKERQRYSDYVRTPSGLQFQDLKSGSGESPKPGQLLTIDWDGYTIGYYGRPFEARNKAKGGSFVGDQKEFFRFVLGDSAVIPAVAEAVATMKVGGIRRLIVPEELGYPNNDFKQGMPRPTTFSGERALDFVLRNQGMIDKTLLIDIELISVRAA